NVIVLFLMGGAASQDMYDLKPNAPAQIRGEFKPAATCVPGIQICEHLPGLARWMHKIAIVRSVNHKAGCHNPLPAFSGYPQPPPTYPPPRVPAPTSMGPFVAYPRRGGEDTPAYVCMPISPGWGEGVRLPGPYAGFLGKRYEPLFSECQPWLDKEVPKDSREG